MRGTIINAVAVLIGSGLGVFLGSRLPDRIRQTVMHGIGLVTVLLGIQMALETQNVLLVMASLLVGGLLGEWLRIDAALERVSEWLRKWVARRLSSESMGHFTEGLVTASLVFCVGPVTVLGAIKDGLSGDYALLAVKSVLDGFSSLVFASSLGVGVIFSVFPLLIYQGGLSLGAGLFQSVLNEVMIQEMSAVGGVLILGLGLVLLEIKEIRVANFLPALVVAPAVVALLQWLGVSPAL